MYYLEYHTYLEYHGTSATNIIQWWNLLRSHSLARLHFSCRGVNGEPCENASPITETLSRFWSKMPKLCNLLIILLQCRISISWLVFFLFSFQERKRNVIEVFLNKTNNRRQSTLVKKFKKKYNYIIIHRWVECYRLPQWIKKVFSLNISIVYPIVAALSRV